MLPRVGNLFKMNDFERIRKYIANSFNFTFFMAFPMMFGLMAISNNFVPWFFGYGYNKVIPNLIVIAPILICISTSNIIGVQFLLPTGHQKAYTISILVGCFVNLFLNLLLIPRFFSIGAAIGSVFAELSVTVVQIFFTRSEFDIKSIIVKSRNYVICSFIMFLGVYILSRVLFPSFINTLICILVGGIIYIGLLFLVKDVTIMNGIYKVKNRKY